MPANSSMWMRCEVEDVPDGGSSTGAEGPAVPETSSDENVGVVDEDAVDSDGPECGANARGDAGGLDPWMRGARGPPSP